MSQPFSSPARYIGVAALASALLGACVDERPATVDAMPEGEPLSGAEAPVPHTSEVAAHMGEHFWQLAIAHDAAIEGDLNSLREAALWMADHDPVEGLPLDATPYLEILRANSLRTAESTGLEVASVALGATAASCGACHRALEVPLPTVIEDDLIADDDLPGQMSAHIRAADLMWEALVAPSDAAWEAGATLLARVEILAEAVADGPDEARLVSELLGQVDDIATASINAAAADRPALYGELLNTCGQCHAALGRGFRP